MKELMEGVVRLVNNTLSDAYQLKGKKCDDLTFSQVQDLAVAIRRVQFAAINLQRMVNRIEDEFVRVESQRDWNEVAIEDKS